MNDSAFGAGLPMLLLWLLLFPDLGEGTAPAILYILGLDSVGTSSCLRLIFSIQAGCTASLPRPKPLLLEEYAEAEDNKGVMELFRGDSSSSIEGGLESVLIFLGGYGSRSLRFSL